MAESTPHQDGPSLQKDVTQIPEGSRQSRFRSLWRKLVGRQDPQVPLAQVPTTTSNTVAESAYSEAVSQEMELPFDATLMLFANSFKYTQGEPDFELQRLLFRAIHSLHPEYRISPAYREELVERVVQAVTTRVEHGEHFEIQESPEQQAGLAANDFYTILNGSTVEDIDDLVPKICARIINRDLVYLTSTDGRPGRDPRDSHFVKYILRQRPAGGVYDDIFKYVHTFAMLVINEEKSSELQRKIQKVENLYAQYHGKEEKARE